MRNVLLFGTTTVLCCTAALMSAVTTTAGVILTGDTNRPATSMFALGEKVELAFNVTGLPADSKNQKLELKIVDAFGNQIKLIELQVVPSSAGTWNGTVTGPSDRLGLYRVQARLANGVAMAARGSRPAGFLTYGITFSPATRKLYPPEQTFFGMQGGTTPGVDSYCWLGVRWILGPTRWSWSEPDYPGQLAARRTQFRAKDKPVLRQDRRQASAWHTYPLFQIVGGNCCLPDKWKTPPYTVAGSVKGWGKLTQEGEKHFAAYCREFASIVAAEYADLSIHYYEVLWEPDLSFNGDPADLVTFFRLAYPAIHAADPKAVVIGPSFSTIGLGTLGLTRKLFEAGLGRYLDAYSIHPYLEEPPEARNLVGLMRELKRIVRDGAGRELPLIGTEFSHSDDGGPAEVERRHAEMYVRQNLITLGEGFALNVSFYNQDCGNKISNRGYYYNLDAKRQYGPETVGPKPQAMMYAAMTWLLEGHRSTGTIDWLGDTAMGYVYENADGVTLALWDYGDRPRPVVIPVGVDRAEVYDVMGNRSPIQTERGNLKLTLGNAPLYVRHVSPRLWGSRAVKPLAAGETELRLFPGDTGKLTVRLAAPADRPLRGELVLSTGDALKLPAAVAVELPAGTVRTLSLAVAARGDAPSGRYPVALLLRENGLVTGGAGTAVMVADPVRLGRIKPASTADGRRSLSFTLQELKNRAEAGTVRLRVAGVPESSREIKFTLNPGEERRFEVIYADLAIHPTRQYDVEGRVELASGYRFERRERLSFLSARRLTAPLKIDGSAAKWSDIPGVELKGLEWCVRSPVYYSGDAATIRYAWNEQALYLRVEVRDQVFMQRQTGSSTWKDDSLQCGFSLEPWREFRPSANTLADEANLPRQCEIELALTPTGPQVWRGYAVPASPSRPHGLLSAPDCRFVALRQNGIIIYEAAFTWAALGLDKSPVPGDHIAVPIAVNDRDAADQSDPSALSLFNGATEKKDRSLMGLLYLEK